MLDDFTVLAIMQFIDAIENGDDIEQAAKLLPIGLSADTVLEMLHNVLIRVIH